MSYRGARCASLQDCAKEEVLTDALLREAYPTPIRMTHIDGQVLAYPG